MDDGVSRRRFLHTASASMAGGMALPAAAQEGVPPTMDVIREQPRDVPVVADVDVCVLGGSCTGVFAAVAAARLGASVALVEWNGFFGGVATASLVNVWHSLFDAKFQQQIIGGLTAEMIERLDPEILRYINEFSYGTIYARPRFSVKQRQLLALMANIVLDRSEVRPHIRNALNLGWEKDDVMEVIATSIVYGGFPVAASALKIADEVFCEWDEEQGAGD